MLALYYDAEDNLIYVSAFLDNYKTFYQRALDAIKYIKGKQAKWYWHSWNLDNDSGYKKDILAMVSKIDENKESTYSDNYTFYANELTLTLSNEELLLTFEYDGEFNDVHATVFLRPSRSIFTRIKRGLKYLLCNDGFGKWAEFQLTNKHKLPFIGVISLIMDESFKKQGDN